jgi:RNA polymerase sigma-70 factor (ECF subfamily)
MDSTVRRTRENVTAIVEPDTEAHARDLLTRIAARDLEAMREFHSLYHLRVTRFLARVATRRELADQILDDVFMFIWQRAAEFNGNLRVTNWVMAIAWRHGLTSVRLEARLAADPCYPPTAHADRIDSRAAFGRAMGTLSPEDRALIELTYAGGYSCEEIGLITECAPSKVKTQLLDARLRLRGELEAALATPAAQTCQ